jgi:hypothetical protein
VEFFDETDELTGVATILTMVAKKKQDGKTDTQ